MQNLFFQLLHGVKLLSIGLSGHPFGHPHDVYSDVYNVVHKTFTTGVQRSVIKLSKRQSKYDENQSRI